MTRGNTNPKEKRGRVSGLKIVNAKLVSNVQLALKKKKKKPFALFELLN